jgi:hypothetical protein
MLEVVRLKIERKEVITNEKERDFNHFFANYNLS